MARVITFSRQFPAYHDRRGEPTFFIEKLWQVWGVDYDYKAPLAYLKLADPCKGVYPKLHTIRKGNRWKVGDKFSPRIWSGRPYNSKQIIIAPDIEIKKIWNFQLMGGNAFINDGKKYREYLDDDFLTMLAKNDGLSLEDFVSWFRCFSYHFEGQILCWYDKLNYV